MLIRIQNFSDFQNCGLWLAYPSFLRGKKFNDRDSFSNFVQDFDKRFNDRDGFSNFMQDIDKSFFHELTSTTCLQQNCKHDELADASIENVIDIKKYSSTQKLYKMDNCISRTPALCLAPGPGLTPGPGSQPWFPICIYRPWSPICIYRSRPPIFIYRPRPPIFIWSWSLNCIYQPWPRLLPAVCIYQSRSRFYYYYYNSH